MKCWRDSQHFEWSWRSAERLTGPPAACPRDTHWSKWCNHLVSLEVPFSQLAAQPEPCVLTFHAPLTPSRRSGWGNKLTELQMDTPKVSWIRDYLTGGPWFVIRQMWVHSGKYLSIYLYLSFDLLFIKPPGRRVTGTINLQKKNRRWARKKTYRSKFWGLSAELLHGCFITPLTITT